MDFSKLIRIDGTEGVPELKRGSLLLAEPLLKEDFFCRAVILLLDVDTNGGVMGLALNKSTEYSLADVIPDWEMGKNIPLYCGGPVDTQRMFMLHSMGDVFPDSIEICPGVFVGGELADIVEYINKGGKIEGKMRFFLGYSGWGGEQLKKELSEHVWAVSEISGMSDMLRGSDNAFWRREVERMGSKYRGWLLVPENPDMN